jgi:cytidylate kinase
VADIDCGPVRSGKSTLARSLVERFGGVRVGFGDAVRQRTVALGLPDERRFWQQVGEDWVASDPEGLCNAVLASTAGQARVVVDGVRHWHVYGLLRARPDDRRVILAFVDADVQARRARLARDGITAATVDSVLHHSTEKELLRLREVADIVLDGTKDVKHVLPVLEALLTGDQDQNSR